MRMLITAGPTHEPIDPIRYIGNRSSGKMGYAIARAAVERSHDVTLVSGPVHIDPPHEARTIRVETAREMYDAVMRNESGMGAIICCAAVADYRPETFSEQKLKKSGYEKVVLRLVENPDILATLGKKNRRWKLVGFAAETCALEKNAVEKLRNKNCDLLFANRVDTENMPFGSDENEVLLFRPDGRTESSGRLDKISLARWMLSKIEND